MHIIEHYIFNMKKLNYISKTHLTNSSKKISSFFLINLVINLNETNSKTKVDLDLPNCSDGLTLEKCISDYLYYDIYTGEKK